MYYDDDEPDYRANIYHDEYADDTDYFALEFDFEEDEIEEE